MMEPIAVIPLLALALLCGFTQCRLIRSRRVAADGEERFQALVERIPDAVLVSEDGRLVYANPAAAELWGVETGALVGREMRSLLDVALCGQCGSAGCDPSGARLEGAAMRPDGGVVTVSSVCLRVRFGGHRAMLTMLQDIGARKRNEAALLEAKENAELACRAKSEFLANVSHELRTPLNAVLGFSQLIESEIFGPIGNPRYVPYVVAIRTSGEQLLAAIEDVLDLARIESGRTGLIEEPTEIVAKIDAALRLIRERAERGQIALATDLAARGVLRADRRRVLQVLVNLLSNAVKFTPPGGTVRVATAWSANGGLDVVIEDTGIGMTPEDIAKSLQPFGQADSRLARKYEGVGLGLPLARGFVEMHGGALSIDSIPGKGTRVTVSFPAERLERAA
ncbi:MAG: PAS domain S-box protein [Alphaproteobacteria bacterium]|nr:PAS domain S-box protein [Alphaproteobacteria bacterium]